MNDKPMTASEVLTLQSPPKNSAKNPMIDALCDPLLTTIEKHQFKLVATVNCKIVGMTLFKDRLFVATEKGVFVKGDDDVLYQLKFSAIEPEAAQTGEAK